jgi:hypothetical protein
MEVMRVCSSQIGVREKQLNAGPEVEKYLRYVNLPKGNPWCAAFVCWVYGQANVPNPRTGWSPDLFPASRIVWQRTGKSPSPKPRRCLWDLLSGKGAHCACWCLLTSGRSPGLLRLKGIPTCQEAGKEMGYTEGGG